MSNTSLTDKVPVLDKPIVKPHIAKQFDLANKIRLLYQEGYYDRANGEGVPVMLQRTVSLKTLLRIVGAFFLLYGFYVIVLVLTSQFETLTAEINYLLCGGLFMGNPTLPGNLYLFGPFMPGPLFWVGSGVLFWGVTSRRVRMAYVCLQLALWLMSLSVWFPIAILIGITSYSPGVFIPFALVTLVLSLALLACYKPVACILHKLTGSKNIAPVA